MKRIIFILIIVLASVSIINSVKSIYSLWKKQDVLITTKNELQKDEKKNQELKSELKEVSASGYIEEQARDKLFMSKPGEDMVFIPKNLLATESAKLQPQTNQPNWLQWWYLFF